MGKRRSVWGLVFLVVLLIAINYGWLDGWLVKTFEEANTIHVDRVIDGDTIESNKSSIRLLGINTPEKGEEYYLEAKEYLEGRILNKSVRLEGNEKDLYGRKLAYVFFEGENINLELIENGLANPYFPEGKERYANEFYGAWENCVKSGNANLCERSTDECAACIVLEEFDYKKEEVVLKNSCSFSCDLNGWEIKDEGRKKFFFDHFVLNGGRKVTIATGEGENSGEKLFWSGEEYVWTDSGDSVFLRDEKNDLILFSNY